MRILALFFMTFVMTLAFDSDLDDDWEIFKQKYGKDYSTEEEEGDRRFAWETNVHFVDKHNLEADNGLHTYTVGINEYADLNVLEFVQMMNGFDSTNMTTNGRIFDSHHSHDDDIPNHVDWSTKGYVTGVKDQGQCGSCWSFSATGSLEGQHFKSTGKLVSLSEQNLVDCDKVDDGCQGGLMEHAFDYIKKNGGIDTESSYPYTAESGPRCLFEKAYVGATLKSYTRIPTGDENALKKAVASVGPISVAIDAGHTSFQLYKSGVYYEPSCSSALLDHGVLVVGYGGGDDDMAGRNYWLVKNSWGTSWGMEGYIKMSRNRHNNCGIATHALYPNV